MKRLLELIINSKMNAKKIKKMDDARRKSTRWMMQRECLGIEIP
jgi:hypothetical protein